MGITPSENRSYHPAYAGIAHLSGCGLHTPTHVGIAPHILQNASNPTHVGIAP